MSVSHNYGPRNNMQACEFVANLWICQCVLDGTVGLNQKHLGYWMLKIPSELLVPVAGKSGWIMVASTRVIGQLVSPLASRLWLCGKVLCSDGT